MTPATPRWRVVAALALVLAGFVVVGRLAVDAWLVRATPERVRIVEREPLPRPGPFLLAVVDGLRAESVDEVVDGVPTMPFWRGLATEGVRGIGVTGEPTMTAACVRSILTGRSPDLYAAFANFNAPSVDGSVTQFLVRRGLRAAHAGDAAAWQLTRRDGAAEVYRREDVIAFPDRGPADQGGTDDASFPFALRWAKDPAIGVLTFHVVRPDHAGHRHGATGEAYRGAVRIVDAQLRQLVEAFRFLRPDATILLTADHGVTARGTHGGGEPGARRAPFVLVGPRVIRREGVELPQIALAPTLCAVLGLPMPPLAESPPALELTTLTPSQRVDAFDAFLRARIAVAQDLGATDLAADADARRRAAFTGAAMEQLGRLVIVYRDLEAGVLGASRFTGGLAVLLAVVWLVALVRAAGHPAHPRSTLLAVLPLASWAFASVAGGWLGAAARHPLGGATAVVLSALAYAWDARPAAPGVRTLTLGGLLAVPMLGGAGLLLQHAFDATEDAGPAASRTVVVFAVVLVAAIAALFRRGTREALARAFDARPALFVAATAGPLGFALSLRLFLDPFVHTPIVFAVVAGLALVAAAWRGRGDPATRGPWRVVLAVAAVLFVGGRVAEGLAPDWILSVRPTGPAWLVGPGLGWRVAAVAALAPVVVAAVRAARTGPGAPLVALAGLGVVAAAALRLGAPAPEALYQVARAALLLALVASPFARASDDAALAARLLACAGLASLYHERSDAQVFVLALVLLGALAAARLPFPPTRRGIAALAVLLVAVKIAAFHGLGFLESFSTIDTGAGVVPGQGAPPPAVHPDAPPTEAATTISTEIWENAVSQVVKFSLVWVALLAAMARSARRTGSLDGLRALGVDLGVALAARGALVALGMTVWWRSSWWVAVAYPTFALALLDALFVLAGLGIAGAFRAPAGAASDAAPAGGPAAPAGAGANG
ncbi:MAG: alkaline phosphatase family protein [Planctomycetia bacterium]|nr:alkaline phosphatase family protein [Planctomycetia bacterium]